MSSIFQLFHDSQFYQYFSYFAVNSFNGGGNRSTWRKLQSCNIKVRELLYHINYTQYTLTPSWIKLAKLVRIGTTCIDRSKSNNHRITTTVVALNCHNMQSFEWIYSVLSSSTIIKLIYIVHLVLYLRNNSWKPECVLSFNMGWWKLVFYPERKRGIKSINILPTHVKTQNTFWLLWIILIVICLTVTVQIR